MQSLCKQLCLIDKNALWRLLKTNSFCVNPIHVDNNLLG